MVATPQHYRLLWLAMPCHRYNSGTTLRQCPSARLGLAEMPSPAEIWVAACSGALKLVGPMRGFPRIRTHGLGHASIQSQLGVSAGPCACVLVYTRQRCRCIPCEVGISSPHHRISLRIIVDGVQWCAGLSHRMNDGGYTLQSSRCGSVSLWTALRLHA